MPSRSDAANGDKEPSKLYRPSARSGDGFSSSFTTARHVLGSRVGAENVPVHSPHKHKFKVAPSENHGVVGFQPAKFAKPLPTSTESPASIGTSLPKADWEDVPDCALIKILPSDLKKNKKPLRKAALNIKKAPARRTDWTPPRYATTWDESPDSKQADFGSGLAQFSHNEEDSSFERIANAKDGELTKRRRINLVRTTSDIPVLKPTAPKSGVKKINKSRSKSPAKKPLTITGLATSHYFGEEQEESTPMMQYLVSTQARMDEGEASGTFETKIKKKAAIKPNKVQPKSRLRSPETVLKTLESQEVIFASASQLVRDDSPTVLRDTLEAIRQSEEHLMSDPIPTQQTAPVSVESNTPKTGVSRFRGRRGLWLAADRDDDDALLHVDDAFDALVFKDVFAGKDALIEQTTTKPRSIRLDVASDRPKLMRNDSEVFDIDEVVTPTLVTSDWVFPSFVKRTYSTVSRPPSSERVKETRQAPQKPSILSTSAPAITKPTNPPLEKPLPTKPDYKNWSDEDLKKQLKGYGVKGMRKRENMIKRLEVCWAEIHGVEILPTQLPVKIPQHGDILSKVHDFAARPPAKAKKLRAKKNKDVNEEVAESAKTKRKKAQETSNNDKTSPKGFKNDAAATESVVDIDSIENLTMSDRVTGIRTFPDDDFLEPSTAAVKGTGVKAVTTQKQKSKPKPIQRLLTPPPTLPAREIPPSSPGFEDLPLTRNADTSSDIPSPQPSTFDSSLKSKILPALKYVDPQDKLRNHQTNLTWYDKVQMYDPIVLEDFTLWLNTEGFNAIGEDGEIDANEVKLWCEEMSVCCLWKGGWRGNKKDRGGD